MKKNQCFQRNLLVYWAGKITLYRRYYTIHTRYKRLVMLPKYTYQLLWSTKLTSKLYCEYGEPTDVKGSQSTSQCGQHGTVFIVPLAQWTLRLLRHLVRSETKTGVTIRLLLSVYVLFANDNIYKNNLFSEIVHVSPVMLSSLCWHAV